jgi:hypothetical protein
MRTAIAILFGVIAALVVAAAPSLAKTTETPKTGEQTAPPACYGYEQQPDGSWKQMPCEERGSDSQGDQKSSTRGEKASH